VASVTFYPALAVCGASLADASLNPMAAPVRDKDLEEGARAGQTLMYETQRRHPSDVHQQQGPCPQGYHEADPEVSAHTLVVLRARSRRCRTERSFKPALMTQAPLCQNGTVTRQEVLQKISELADDQFATVAPFLEADLESTPNLASLHNEIDAGRKSAALEPLQEANEVYTRIRKRLAD
jgi:hypothetical protein